MAPKAGYVKQAPAKASGNNDARRDEGACERLDARFRVGFALAQRGLDLDSLAADELSELEETVRERLSPVLDLIVERWQDAHGTPNELDQIDRALRRIVAQKDPLNSDCECEGCGYHCYDHCAFTDFHGLFLCDGCVEEARDALREIQRPLIEMLEAEPTLDHARALGFELTRRGDGRLVWVGEDDDYDGGKYPYANEHEALEDLVGELT